MNKVLVVSEENLANSAAYRGWYNRQLGANEDGTAVDELDQEVEIIIRVNERFSFSAHTEIGADFISGLGYEYYGGGLLPDGSYVAPMWKEIAVSARRNYPESVKSFNLHRAQRGQSVFKNY